MIREIIHINEDLCNGCGDCIPACHEGALKIVNGKARLVSDVMCDGLGDCLGHCPQGAITIEKREAELYDEDTVKQNKVTNSLINKDLIVEVATKSADNELVDSTSQLTHWPVQLHLLNPQAPYFCNADVLLSADCVAYSVGNFHQKWLKGKSLAIACPKLDSGIETYIAKIKAMIDEAKINTLTVMIMQVPCCGGLLRIVQTAAQQAKRRVPIKLIVIGIEGEIITEEWTN